MRIVFQGQSYCNHGWNTSDTRGSLFTKKLMLTWGLSSKENHIAIKGGSRRDPNEPDYNRPPPQTPFNCAPPHETHFVGGVNAAPRLRRLLDQESWLSKIIKALVKEIFGESGLAKLGTLEVRAIRGWKDSWLCHASKEVLMKERKMPQYGLCHIDCVTWAVSYWLCYINCVTWAVSHCLCHIEEVQVKATGWAVMNPANWPWWEMCTLGGKNLLW